MPDVRSTTRCRERWSGLLLVVLIAGLGCSASTGRAAAQEKEITIDVAVPQPGRDGVAGVQAATTLADAIARVATTSADTIDIRVAAGRYPSRPMVLVLPAGVKRLTISGTSNPGERPTFVPSGPAPSTFLVVKTFDAQPVTIELSDLHIDGFWGGVRIKCGANGESSAAKVSLQRLMLSNIGAASGDHARPGYFAASLLGCRGSLVRDNDFVNVWNQPANGPELIHALYLAHGSSGAVIEDNRFRAVSGAPIKLRDRSGSATVRRNVFERAGRSSVVQQWFCDSTRVARCAAAARKRNWRECPSYCNTVEDNRIGVGFLGKEVAGLVHERTGPGARECPPARCAVASDGLSGPPTGQVIQNQ